MSAKRASRDAHTLEDLKRLLKVHDIDSRDPDRFARAHAFIDELPETLRSLLGPQRQVISPDATVHETAIIGDDVVIFPRTYVGPHCYLRSSTVLFSGVYLGYLVETNVSVLFEDVQVHHAAVVCQSIIGSGSNLAFGFATTTRRVDRKPVTYADPSGRRQQSPASHHGAVVGRNVVTGAHVLLMPGTSVTPSVTLRPQRCFRGFIAEAVDAEAI